MQLLAIGDINYLFPLVMIGAIVFLLNRIRRKRANASNRDSSELRRSPPKRGSPAAYHRAPPDVARYEVEMHDLARELSARLDSKLVLLQHLVRDADQQASRLEAAIAEAGEISATDATQDNRLTRSRRPSTVPQHGASARR